MIPQHTAPPRTNRALIALVIILGVLTALAVVYTTRYGVTLHHLGGADMHYHGAPQMHFHG